VALPGDVTTFTLRIGHTVNGYTDPTGAVSLVGAKGWLFTVDPTTNRRVNVTHVATGQTLVPSNVDILLNEDGKAKATVSPLPYTDDAKLAYWDGSAFRTGFAYRVEWDIPSGSRSFSPRNKTFAVPAASGATVDFDLLDVAEAVPGVLVAVAVHSVNGETGVVTLSAADVGAATPADLATGLAVKVDTSTYTAAIGSMQTTALSSFQGSRQLAPTVQKYAGNPIFTVAQTTGPSIYWPCIVKVAGVLSSPVDAWYMYYSTNHAGAAGAIYLATGPSHTGPWTQYGTGPIYSDRVIGTETETPTVLLDPDAPTGEKVKLYYQNSSLGASQSTHLAMGDDGITFTRYTATVPILLGSVTENPGDGHTGYFHLYRFGGLWFGYSLNGGGNNPHFALWRSRDGKNWQRDPRLLHRDLGRLFVWRGELWGLNSRTTGISGANPGTMLGWRLQRVADDLRHGLGAPIDITLALQGWETTGGQLPGAPVADDTGALWIPYYNLPNVGFGLLKVVQS
jgi:hypothetical protein